MIITVTLNPALDKTISVSELVVGGVNRVEQVRLDAGGKGINVSKTLRQLGGDTLAMGVLGGGTGAYIESTLERLGIKHDFCKVDAPTRTNIKIVDRAAQTSTDMNERGESVNETALDMLFEKLKQKAKAGDTVVFAGSNPPGTRSDLLRDWTLELKRLGVHVFLDTTGEALRLGIQAGPTLIKPNKDELESFCGHKMYSDDDIVAAAEDLIRQGVERVVVSLGADGALFVTEDQVLRGNGLQISVFSAVGAGDSMVGAIAHGMEQNLSWRDIAAWSIAVSAAHVADWPDEDKKKLAEELRKQVCIEEINKI